MTHENQTLAIHGDNSQHETDYVLDSFQRDAQSILIFVSNGAAAQL